MAQALMITAALEFRVGLALEEAGVDPRRVGIEPGGRWPDHDARVDYRRLERALKEGHRLVPDLALRMAATARPDTLNPASALLIAAPTLCAGLEAGLSYWTLWSSQRLFDFDPAGGWLRYYWPPGAEVGPATAVLSECMFAEGLIGMRTVTGHPMRPLALELDHGPELSCPGITTLFGVLPRYHAAGPAMRIAAEDLERALPTRNPILFAYLAEQAAALAARLPSEPSCREAVQRAVEHDPTLTLTVMAARLAMSPRALQRQLAAESASFADLLDGVRQRRALEAVRRGERVERVAKVLGFSDARAFRRAFRRWTGSTPSSWRAAADPK